ncbi:DUF885 domain-containing protein [Reichenbachiella carrageenanivorans]|uniref:DUF885 domain-containing protein n=1 Tax=Reichenbachiella carrageenanivorans TaxID=2979869 RepID=A0ABY6D437_9BACT|nr:DUF885 domain-containing protein [Reichenbachiella carrageenanivorans]UXX80926.1 DUF885 domain-containing protein [Reichenbachiella carrageenanivorans]
MNHLKNVLFITLAFVMACTPSKEKKSYTLEEVAAESKKANDFFERSFNEGLDRSPEFQTYLGIKTQQGEWDDYSDEIAKKELEITKQELQWLMDSINVEALDHNTKVSYNLFVAGAQDDIDGFKYRFHNYPVNQMFGMHSSKPAFLINMHQITNKEDAEAYISRLSKFNVIFDQLIVNLKIREEKGIVPPKFVFPRVISDSKNLLTGAPFEAGEPSTLLADFTAKVEKVEDLPEEEKEGLIARANEALLGGVKPAYESLISFLTEQEKRATTDDGAWKFPDGEAFFNYALKNTTTTELTSNEIHEIGLKEVGRIHGEMKDIMAVVGFEGDLKDFFEFLKTDDQFYYPNTEEGKQDYLDSATATINYMKGRLDELFITKPKAELVVKRVEAFREKSAGSAFYQSPAPDGSRPGTYYANLANTRDMAKYDIEALAYHEGIPGHHMQLSIAQELDGLPKFRKFGHYTAYSEGWGLYCEFIPKEMGLYENPYSNYGRLAAELWRACRLVVDTGIHSKKWTREEGIAYYQANTSASPRDCERMVERHIVMPSQATAYKIGMLKILELREGAKAKLGDQFDIREFHDVVLTSGAVPLHLLETMVNDWVASKS